MSWNKRNLTFGSSPCRTSSHIHTDTEKMFVSHKKHAFHSPNGLPLDVSMFNFLPLKKQKPVAVVFFGGSQFYFYISPWIFGDNIRTCLLEGTLLPTPCSTMNFAMTPVFVGRDGSISTWMFTIFYHLYTPENQRTTAWKIPMFNRKYLWTPTTHEKMKAEQNSQSLGWNK